MRLFFICQYIKRHRNHGEIKERKETRQVRVTLLFNSHYKVFPMVTFQNNLVEPLPVGFKPYTETIYSHGKNF